MPSVRKNIVANILGGAWTAILSIAFIPLYIHFMGIDAYGLVGFYVTLQVVFSLLDMGLTTTISRELARLSAIKQSALEMHNAVRTLEVVYWGIAILIMLVVFFSSEWLANYWLSSNQLSQEVVQKAIVLMGFAISFKMPYGFYCGALIGLQRQVCLNVIRVIVETLRSGGVVLILMFLSPTIDAFFLWHLGITALAALCMRSLVHRSIPKTLGQARFSILTLQKLWRFAAGVTGISLLSVLLVESDKLILSKLFTLDQFGIYVLASTVALGLNLIIVPVFSAMQPRLTQLVEQNNEVLLKRIYHQACQLMSVLVLPLALVLCFFSDVLLLAWTQDPITSAEAAPILSILVMGTACNALMNMPYALQLAHAWTKLSLISNCIAIVILIPALLFLVPLYGLIGAAVIWVALNVGYLLFNAPIVYAKLLKGEFMRWVVVDIGAPLLTALAVVVGSWYLLPEESNLVKLIWVAFTLILAVFISAISAKSIRVFLTQKITFSVVSDNRNGR